MATEQEILDARKKVDDNVDLESAIANLSTLNGAVDEFDLIIRVGNTSFSLSRLKTSLEDNGTDYDTMVTSMEDAIKSAIGADDVTAGTFRKALRDLVDAHDASIAAT